MSTNTGVYKWSTFDRVFNTVLTFGGNITLAWLLTPADFGLLAMVGIFTAIAYNISSCGLGDGIIRKLHPTETDYSTMFVFNTAVGFLFGLAFYCGAPLIARFFDSEPVEGIMRVIGICFFVQSMGLVQEIRLRKLLLIKRMAIARIASTACAVGLGIVIAICGGSYWGLVSCRVFVSVFFFFFSLFATRWFPRIQFSMASFREMFAYGVNLMASYLMLQIGRNINATILGKFSPTESGIYSQAQKMNDVPYTIVDSSLTQTFFPVVSNEADPGRRHALVAEMLTTVLLTNVTLTLLLVVMAYPGFYICFGQKWLGCVPVFQILVWFGLLLNIKQFVITVMKAHSVTGKIRNLTIVETAIQLGLLAAMYRMGIMWIAATQVIAALLTLAFYVRYYCRYEATTLRQMLRDNLPAMAAPVAAFLITLGGSLMWGPVVNKYFNAVFTLAVFGGVFMAVCTRLKLPVYVRLLQLLNRKK